jgi:hypothetical protein
LERIFFVFLITFADVIFALAFGLLAEVTANLRKDNSQQQFLSKIIQTRRIMETAEFNENWKDRIEQFLTYKH